MQKEIELSANILSVRRCVHTMQGNFKGNQLLWDQILLPRLCWNRYNFTLYAHFRDLETGWLEMWLFMEWAHTISVWLAEVNFSSNKVTQLEPGNFSTKKNTKTKTNSEKCLTKNKATRLHVMLRWNYLTVARNKSKLKEIQNSDIIKAGQSLNKIDAKKTVASRGGFSRQQRASVNLSCRQEGVCLVWSPLWYLQTNLF